MIITVTLYLTAQHRPLRSPDMIDLANTEFGTRLISPDGMRFELTDGGDDTRGMFVWLVPIGTDGYRTGARRQRLRQDQAEGWTVEDQADEDKNRAAAQVTVPAAKSRPLPEL